MEDPDPTFDGNALRIEFKMNEDVVLIDGSLNQQHSCRRDQAIAVSTAQADEAVQCTCWMRDGDEGRDEDQGNEGCACRSTQWVSDKHAGRRRS